VGRGSYEVVKELKFRGLKCVGKKIHDELFNSATPLEQAAMLERFAGECELLGGLHHPCIVVTLGTPALEQQNTSVGHTQISIHNLGPQVLHDHSITSQLQQLRAMWVENEDTCRYLIPISNSVTPIANLMHLCAYRGFQVACELLIIQTLRMHTACACGWKTQQIHVRQISKS